MNKLVKLEFKITSSRGIYYLTAHQIPYSFDGSICVVDTSKMGEGEIKTVLNLVSGICVGETIQEDFEGGEVVTHKVDSFGRILPPI